MKALFTRTKVFDGKTYHFFTSKETKLEAERIAYELKRKGYKSRVYAPSKFEFGVYSRPDTPWYGTSFLRRRRAKPRTSAPPPIRKRK